MGLRRRGTRCESREMSIAPELLELILVAAVSISVWVVTWGLSFPTRLYWPCFVGWSIFALLLVYLNFIDLQSSAVRFLTFLLIGSPVVRLFVESIQRILADYDRRNNRFPKVENDLKKEP